MIRAANESQDNLKEIDSQIMKMDAGQLKMVETEEISESRNIWDQYSFTTRNKSYIITEIGR
ncbi:hypothetical protein ACFQ4A_07320 [Lentibacillus salinarum]|uniref:Uncharacterized protein n=1 Tax=Lentibacillus salinarum TaxID=446820 RepID=A0ABW3ZSY0_9BACI